MKLKYILVLLLICIISSTSCKKNKKYNMVLNHYKSVCVGGEAAKMCFVVQEDDEIGTSQWSNFYDNIDGFSGYKWGYTYKLEVKRKKILFQAIDGPSYKYKLIDMIIEEKAPANVTFTIPFKFGPYQEFVKGDSISGYSFFNEINIDFENDSIMNSFIKRYNSDEELSGVFKHKDENTIILIEIK